MNWGCVRSVIFDRRSHTCMPFRRRPPVQWLRTILTDDGWTFVFGHTGLHIRIVTLQLPAEQTINAQFILFPCYSTQCPAPEHGYRNCGRKWISIFYLLHFKHPVRLHWAHILRKTNGTSTEFWHFSFLSTHKIISWFEIHRSHHSNNTKNKKKKKTNQSRKAKKKLYW